MLSSTTAPKKRRFSLAVGSVLVTALPWSLMIKARAAPSPANTASTVVKLPDGPGSVRGLGSDAEVDIFSAQVRYHIPLDAPRAGAGFGPKLGLSYSGELGNGPLGVGWRMHEMLIRRSVRHGVPTFSPSDELEIVGLGGGKLVPVGDGSYRIEGQGNEVVIRRMGGRFVATDSEGQRYFFGLSENARVFGPDGRVTEWRIELAVHPSQESIRYHYTREGHALYLHEILWGPQNRYRAAVRYEKRSDPSISFRQGIRIETKKRVASIAIESSGQELRKIHLNYDESHPLSRLSSVHMTGYQGQGALPTIRFSYGAPNRPKTVALEGTDGWVLGRRGVTLHDVDGDGMEDLLRMEMGNHQFRKNVGGRFLAQKPLHGATGLELQRVRFVDLDGDARPELIRVVNDRWRASTLDGTHFRSLGEVPGTKNLPLFGAHAALADLNGDGRTDVVRGAASGILTSLVHAHGMADPQFFPRIGPHDPQVDPGQARVRFVDFNGDGLSDVVWLTDAWMKIFLGKGDGTFVPWRRSFYPWGEGGFDLSDLHLFDLNRDGLMDVVVVSAGHVLYYRGNADGSLDARVRKLRRPESVTRDVVVRLADLNGNGSLDVVWSSPRGMWLLDLAGATHTAMLTEIDNGLGRVVSFRYASSAVLSVSAHKAGRPWDHTLPVSIPVPVETSIDLGDNGPVRKVLYRIRDGVWDRHRREFAGFLKSSQIAVGGEDATHMGIRTTRYHAGLGKNRVLRGKTQSVELVNGLGERHKRTHTRWAAHPVADLPDHPSFRVPVTRETRTQHYEGVSTPIETLVWLEHDNQGRVIREHNLGRLDQSGDEVVRHTRYAEHDPKLHVRNRVCESKTFEHDGTLLSWTQTFYGGPTKDPKPLCQAGLGLERETYGWLKSEARWVRQKAALAYNEAWKPLRLYEGGIHRTIGYDPLGLFPETETVEPNSGQTLTWTMHWDTVRGLPESYIDPSGAVQHLTHDALGRLLSVAQDHHPAHMHYVYDWRAALPTTTTFVFDGELADLGPLPNDVTPDSGWRQTTSVSNGAGEVLFRGVRLEPNRWLIDEWKERDHKGRVTSVYEAFYFDGSDLRRATPGDTEKQRLRYDAFDRVREHILPDGTKKSLTFRAFERVQRQDDLNPVTSLLDGQGRIRRTERTVDGVVESIEASYDASGRILNLSLQAGSVEHTFRYDSLGRLVFASDPDMGPRTLTYNDQNLLVRQENGENEGVTYTYDGAGRLARTESDDATVYQYHYDAAQDPTHYKHTAGRLAWVEEPTGQVELGYDAFGRQIQIKRRVDTLSAGETTRYSPSGLMLEVQYDDDLSVPMSYDAAGRAVAAGDLWTLESQDAEDRILRERFGNGVLQTFERNRLGRELPTLFGKKPPVRSPWRPSFKPLVPLLFRVRVANVSILGKATAPFGPPWAPSIFIEAWALAPPS